ncbi:DUF1997 domain-containing protein [Synechococcus sp. RSCCF101]|nr:DUF1997 domain-containing protein [Synechococcus sp. RSCCF101]
MRLAFGASQGLSLMVSDHADQLPAYLQQEERVLQALLDPRHLTAIHPGLWRYEVTRVQVFQLSVQPVVTLQVHERDGQLTMEATECSLEGLGLVDDFDLRLKAQLAANGRGLEGEARLAVEVSRPPLLRLIPRTVLEATGQTVLNGILLGIKGRVGQQLLRDFRRWVAQPQQPASGSPAEHG